MVNAPYLTQAAGLPLGVPTTSISFLLNFLNVTIVLSTSSSILFTLPKPSFPCCHLRDFSAALHSWPHPALNIFFWVSLSYHWPLSTQMAAVSVLSQLFCLASLYNEAQGSVWTLSSYDLHTHSMILSGNCLPIFPVQLLQSWPLTVN